MSSSRKRAELIFAVHTCSIVPRKQGYFLNFTQMHDFKYLKNNLLSLYAYCSFSVVIGQIMVTWPPYKIDIWCNITFQPSDSELPGSCAQFSTRTLEKEPNRSKLRQGI